MESLFAVCLGFRIQNPLTLEIHGDHVAYQGVVGFRIFVGIIDNAVDFREAKVTTDAFDIF
jgi:hypothetical protein